MQSTFDSGLSGPITILCSLIRDWPNYTPRHWVPCLSPFTTRRDCGGGILTPYLN
jgi:hypothetical protein